MTKDFQFSNERKVKSHSELTKNERIGEPMNWPQLVNVFGGPQSEESLLYLANWFLWSAEM